MNPAQRKRWCWTLNNYTDAEIAKIDLCGDGDECTYLIYGYEVGDSGTPHLQGFVIFTHSQRLEQAKQLISDRCHFEPTGGTSPQAADYCKKDGNFKESGILPNSQGKRSDWDRYEDWIKSLERLPTRRELCCKFPALYSRYSKKCYEIATHHLPPPNLVGDNEPRFGWQSRLQARIQAEKFNEREVDFVVNPEGKAGKTWMCQWAISRFSEKVQILRIGKRDDLAYSIDETKSIFLLDCPRNQMQFLQYSVLESLKDRMIFSPKYESCLKILSVVPYVAVFCNEEPDVTEMTDDRFNIIRV